MFKYCGAVTSTDYFSSLGSSFSAIPMTPALTRPAAAGMATGAMLMMKAASIMMFLLVSSGSFAVKQSYQFTG